MNTASLISPDFLASDYQYGVELQRAIQRHDNNEAHVIPILVRPCDWKLVAFAKLQVIPRNELPISLWQNHDAGFAEVAKEIRMALETLPSLAFCTPLNTLPTIWNVPYARNPFFTGREDLFSQMAVFFQKGAATALS